MKAYAGIAVVCLLLAAPVSAQDAPKPPTDKPPAAPPTTDAEKDKEKEKPKWDVAAPSYAYDRQSEKVWTMVNGRLYDAATLSETGDRERKRAKYWWEP